MNTEFYIVFALIMVSIIFNSISITIKGKYEISTFISLVALGITNCILMIIAYHVFEIMEKLRM